MIARRMLLWMTVVVAVGSVVSAQTTTADGRGEITTGPREREPSKTLAEAAKRGYLEQMEFFLEKGADVDAVDKYGRTVLMLASMGRNPFGDVASARGDFFEPSHVNSMRHLLENGANGMITVCIGCFCGGRSIDAIALDPSACFDVRNRIQY